MVKVELQKFVTLGLTGMTLEEAKVIRDQLGKAPWGTPVVQEAYDALNRKIFEVEGI